MKGPLTCCCVLLVDRLVVHSPSYLTSLSKQQEKVKKQWNYSRYSWSYFLSLQFKKNVRILSREILLMWMIYHCPSSKYMSEELTVNKLETGDHLGHWQFSQSESLSRPSYLLIIVKFLYVVHVQERHFVLVIISLKELFIENLDETLFLKRTHPVWTVHISFSFTRTGICKWPAGIIWTF